jgi:hypothetical protein
MRREMAEVFYPDDKPLSWAEKIAIWKGEDPREPWRERRARNDELSHSHLDPIDLDDPVVLSEEYWDIWPPPA